MPAADDSAKERAARRLPIALLWTGLALTPLAALIVFVTGGQGGLRAALVLAVLALVLIGVSIMLRHDSEELRSELEETLFSEIDSLREGVRRDIATAAEAQHRQFSEKLQTLYESLEALRGQVDALRAMYDRSDRFAGGHAPGGQHLAGGGYGGRGHAGPPGPPMVPGGVVRHTETVQVTTRHTIVDPHADGEPGRGTIYGGGAYAGTVYGSGARYGAPEPIGRGRHSGREWSDPAEESWTEQRLRERFAGRPDLSMGEPRGHDGRPMGLRDSPEPHTGGFSALELRGGAGRRRYERDLDDPGDDERWSTMRAGDRWASVRTDERGRELRMGERRAAVHTDETGTELRFEDRWASVRRDEPRGGWPDDRWSENRWGPGVEETGRWDDGPASGALAALPSVDSGWDRWGRQVDTGHDWADESRSRSRGHGFEYTDERWLR